MGVHRPWFSGWRAFQSVVVDFAISGSFRQSGYPLLHRAGPVFQRRIGPGDRQIPHFPILNPRRISGKERLDHRRMLDATQGDDALRFDPIIRLR
jgi:hypothetical protein